MRRILVPLDGSPLAEAALPYAMTMAQALSAELDLLHAVSGPSGSNIGMDIDSGALQAKAFSDQLEAKASNYLLGIAECLENAGAEVRCTIQHGRPVQSIVECAMNADSAQIIMATRGHRILKHWIRAGVAERVLQASTTPMLLLHASEKHPESVLQTWACHRIMVLLDGTEDGEQVLPVITPIARALDSKIILVNMIDTFVPGPYPKDYEDASSYLTRIADQLTEQGIQTLPTVGIGTRPYSLIRHVQIHQVDLVAQSIDCRPRFRDRILGRPSDCVLRAIGIPMLLVPATANLHA